MDAVLVRQCSPTLRGVKTGSLFVCKTTSRNDLTLKLRRWNRILGEKGVRVLPLKTGVTGVLIYVYRPAQLTADLAQPPVARLLQERGYDRQNAVAAITRLRRRLMENPGFPHEIGLFLGYPPEDVRGFIEHRAQHFQLAGCWKVYGDPDAAKQRFSQLKLCTARCCRAYARGRSLEQLTQGSS